MGELVGFPGVDPDARRDTSGEPRPDIAEALRILADRAERGELDALCAVFSISDGGMGSLVCTPENCYYSMLGAVEELKYKIKERDPETERTVRTIDPDGAA